MSGKLSASSEDYIEAIYLISQNQPVIRVKDISKKMKVSMPSVNSAVKILAKNGLVDFEKYGYIQLTELGQAEGLRIFQKHTRLKKFFTDILNVPADIAEEDACKIEHYISAETMERLDIFIRYIQECHEKNDIDWKSVFEKHYKDATR